LADPGKSLWFDESFLLAHFARRGPAEIIACIGLSHELYGCSSG
jgi:hypothetical protein